MNNLGKNIFGVGKTNGDGDSTAVASCIALNVYTPFEKAKSSLPVVWTGSKKA